VKVDVVDTNKSKVGEIDLEDSVFASRVKPWLFWEVVKMQMANRRRGTQSTKTITEVSGTGKKPYRQKGTGRARQGSTRSAHMRGGAVVLGPKPRSYSYKLPRKMMQGALRSALSLRNSEQKLSVIQGWSPDKPKTKSALAVLSKFDTEKALVVGSTSDENLRLSLRNLPHSKFLPVEGLNVYDILDHDHLFITDAVVDAINKRLKTAASRKDQRNA